MKSALRATVEIALASICDLKEHATSWCCDGVQIDDGQCYQGSNVVVFEHSDTQLGLDCKLNSLREQKNADFL